MTEYQVGDDVFYETFGDVYGAVCVGLAAEGWPHVMIGDAPVPVNPSRMVTRERWLATLKPGDEVEVRFPNPGSTASDVDWHLRTVRDWKWNHEDPMRPLAMSEFVAGRDLPHRNDIRPVRAKPAVAPRSCSSCTIPMVGVLDVGGLRCNVCDVSTSPMHTTVNDLVKAVGMSPTTAPIGVPVAGTSLQAKASDFSHGLVMGKAPPPAIEMVSRPHHEAIVAAYQATIAALTERLRLATQPAPSRERGAGLLMVAEMKGIGR